MGRLDPRTGKPFFDHGGEVNAGWTNAVKGVDGWGRARGVERQPHQGVGRDQRGAVPAHPARRDYLTDSGGAGQWRGGCGSYFVKEARTPTSVNQYVVNQRHLHPGIAGGAPGSPDSCVISAGTDREVTVNPTVAGAVMETGDQLVYRFGGGGGWGDPLLRDPNAVLDDVWDEYVSIDAARDQYGVVITGSLEDMTLALDDDATEKLRASMRPSRQ